MAYIRALKWNNRADVRMKGIVKNKTFPTQSLAQVWAEKIEHSIKIIPNLEPSALIALSEAEIDGMGGEELFKQRALIYLQSAPKRVLRRITR